MREAENIREVEQLKVDMIGFIFYPKSPRCLYELPAYMPVKAKRVGVFVNEDKKEIEIFADRFSLDYIQLPMAMNRRNTVIRSGLPDCG